MKCSKVTSTPRGPLTVAMTPVEILQSKALFFVGTFIDLRTKKVRLRDVVIPSRLTSPSGSKVLANTNLIDLARVATNGWVVPLENPDALLVKVHCVGDIPKQSLIVACKYDDLHGLYPKAVAVETRGEGMNIFSHSIDKFTLLFTI